MALIKNAWEYYFHQFFLVQYSDVISTYEWYILHNNKNWWSVCGLFKRRHYVILIVNFFKLILQKKTNGIKWVTLFFCTQLNFWNCLKRCNKMGKISSKNCVIIVYNCNNCLISKLYNFPRAHYSSRNIVWTNFM